MSDNSEDSGFLADDMGEYLQTFLDETEEQLDDLVETLLALEDDPTNDEDLNEAFRLIHSIKGSAGMMGLDTITVLTHQLENRFERFRSGLAQIDKSTMNLVLRCIDFLRTCTARLRDGEQLGSAAELLDELKQLEAADEEGGSERIQTSSEDSSPEVTSDEAVVSQTQAAGDAAVDSELLRMVVHFRQGLQLVDLKAQLILNRLSKTADIHSTIPDIESLSEDVNLEKFEIRLDTDQDPESFRAAANVEGVESIEFVGRGAEQLSQGESAGSDESRSETEAIETATDLEDHGTEPDDSTGDSDEVNLPVNAAHEREEVPHEESADQDDADQGGVEPGEEGEEDFVEEDTLASSGPDESILSSPASHAEATDTEQDQLHRRDDDSERISSDPKVSGDMPSGRQATDDTTSTTKPTKPKESKSPTASGSTPKAGETMRVDIERLDGLMNLVGELVVNRARLEQISEQVNPAFRKSGMVNRFKEFSETLQRTIKSLEIAESSGDDWSTQIQHLRSGLALLSEQSEIWDNGRQCFNEMSDAVDHLSRVSHGLQSGVLDTRMVPVGPLFNRFKRVVRDLSQERGKRVRLSISGEKTELDKRMIDELGDPLVHLVRNSIDHGLESPAERRSAGKPEEGSITLEASHSGNNVFIYVRDDGAGINVDKIKAKLLDRRLMSPDQVAELSDDEVLEQIWNPGFSTAESLTDVSGRGVGMDVVKTRIQQLKGTVTVDSRPHEGTTFTIRLPLTMAIINSLLIRLEDVTFSLPIDDVREIVSVHHDSVVTVQAKQTFEVRGEYIPLVKIDEIFHWHGVDYGHRRTASNVPGHTREGMLDIVVLQSRGKTLGLRVDELLGGQDIVIKSLSDNFVDVRGLSGASILGDGGVCLMLDVTTLFEMAMNTPRSIGDKEPAL